jgi:hypothetical protein
MKLLHSIGISKRTESQWTKVLDLEIGCVGTSNQCGSTIHILHRTRKYLNY